MFENIANSSNEFKTQKKKTNNNNWTAILFVRKGERRASFKYEILICNFLLISFSINDIAEQQLIIWDHFCILLLL